MGFPTVHDMTILNEHLFLVILGSGSNFGAGQDLDGVSHFFFLLVEIPFQRDFQSYMAKPYLINERPFLVIFGRGRNWVGHAQTFLVLNTPLVIVTTVFNMKAYV